MPRGASSFMPEGEATNMGTYVPGTVTPGQRLSRSEKTNRIMAAMAAHPSMAALAPMYVQNMQSEVEDQRYQAGLDRAEAARVLEATRYAEEQKQKAADDAESLRRYEKTLAATNAGRSPGTPQSYLVDGKPFFGTPQDALDLSRQGKIVTTPKTDKPETQFQASSAGFADRMITANKYITDPAVIAAATSQAQMRRGNVPVIGNYLTSDAKKSLDQAKLSFVNAKLRQESGATIGDPEFVKADLQYFPQPGDGPEQIKQKEIERNIVINGMVRSAGPDYERLDPEKQELEYRRSLKARGG
jgi:hypothetical protein